MEMYTDKTLSVGNEVGVAIGMYVSNAIGVAVGIAVGMVVCNVVGVAAGFASGITVSMAVRGGVGITAIWLKSALQMVWLVV